MRVLSLTGHTRPDAESKSIGNFSVHYCSKVVLRRLYEGVLAGVAGREECKRKAFKAFLSQRWRSCFMTGILCTRTHVDI